MIQTYKGCIDISTAEAEATEAAAGAKARSQAEAADAMEAAAQGSGSGLDWRACRAFEDAAYQASFALYDKFDRLRAAQVEGSEEYKRLGREAHAATYAVWDRNYWLAKVVCGYVNRDFDGRDQSRWD